MTAVMACVALGLMTVATYLTRVSGYLAVNTVKMTPPLTNALEATTGAALVAIVAPAAVDGDLGSQIALGTAAIAMIFTRKPLVAVVAGAVAAAVTRNVV